MTSPNLYVAMSCLQGRDMRAAFDELATLGVGIQLTPGNVVTPGFEAHVASSGVTTRRHHGFAWTARKQPVWADDGTCLVHHESVHPPKRGGAWTTAPIVEVMYPEYELGTGDEVERAMADGRVLAVDISHVFIQRERGAMTESTWRRLADYPHIAEVHVSANRGQHDTHKPITPATFGLGWARAKLASGTPTVLESYMHRLTSGERRGLLDLVTGEP